MKTLLFFILPTISEHKHKRKFPSVILYTKWQRNRLKQNVKVFIRKMNFGTASLGCTPLEWIDVRSHNKEVHCKFTRSQRRASRNRISGSINIPSVYREEVRIRTQGALRYSTPFIFILLNSIQKPDEVFG